MDRLSTTITRFKELFLANKRMLIPLIPLVLLVIVFFFFVVLTLFSSPPPPPTKQNGTVPTITNEENNPTDTPPISAGENNASVDDGDVSVSYEDSSNFEKKATLSDGSIKIFSTSDVPGRPNVVITSKNGQQTIFERSVLSPNDPPLLPDYIDAFGQPEKTTSSPKFYGSNTRTYIYAQTRGFAFVANLQTTAILETHYFNPMSVDEYIKKYGQD